MDDSEGSLEAILTFSGQRSADMSCPRRGLLGNLSPRKGIRLP